MSRILGVKDRLCNRSGRTGHRLTRTHSGPAPRVQLAGRDSQMSLLPPIEPKCGLRIWQDQPVSSQQERASCHEQAEVDNDDRRAVPRTQSTPWLAGPGELYKDIHAHPELSMQETRTAGMAAERLRAAGLRGDHRRRQDRRRRRAAERRRADGDAARRHGRAAGRRKRPACPMPARSRRPTATGTPCR